MLARRIQTIRLVAPPKFANTKLATRYTFAVLVLDNAQIVWVLTVVMNQSTWQFVYTWCRTSHVVDLVTSRISEFQKMLCVLLCDDLYTIEAVRAKSQKCSVGNYNLFTETIFWLTDGAISNLFWKIPVWRTVWKTTIWAVAPRLTYSLENYNLFDGATSDLFWKIPVWRACAQVVTLHAHLWYRYVSAQLWRRCVSAYLRGKQLVPIRIRCAISVKI